MKGARMIVTIDGPAGAGKSSVAKAVAERLSFLHLDSGAVYRAMGIACKIAGVDLDDEREVVDCCRGLSVDINDNGRLIVNDQDFTDAIRAPDAGKFASKVARFKGVRALAVDIIRSLAFRGKGVVVDGRDAGSAIFPDADVKIFLTASPEERARRRFSELRGKDFDVSFNDVLEEILSRDRMDSDREHSPLRIPNGAIVLDTTNMSFERVVSEVVSVIESHPNMRL